MGGKRGDSQNAGGHQIIKSMKIVIKLLRKFLLFIREMAWLYGRQDYSPQLTHLNRHIYLGIAGSLMKMLTIE